MESLKENEPATIEEAEVTKPAQVLAPVKGTKYFVPKFTPDEIAAHNANVALRREEIEKTTELAK